MGADQETSPDRNQASVDDSGEITDTDDSFNEAVGAAPKQFEYPIGSAQDNLNVAFNATMDAAMAVATEAVELSGKLSNGIIYTDESDKEEFTTELKKFSLPAGEKVIQWYSCAIYPKRGMLTHGTMYVTQNYLCFQGWPEVKVVLEIKDIASVTRSNSVIFIANCVVLTTNDGVEYSFGSFTNRDLCYNLILSMVNVKKGVYQALKPPSTMSSSKGIAVAASERDSEVYDAAKAVSSLLDDDDGDEREEKEGHSMIATIEGERENTAQIVTPKQAIQSPNSFLEEQSSAPKTMGTDIELPKLFSKNEIFGLHKQTMPHSVKKVYSEFWEKASGWKNYLLHEGDLDVQCEEWKRRKSEKIPEDSCNLSFQYTRLCTYAHPRTTMLMFGPKNAPATQNQYLHVCSGTSSSPTKFIVVTVTQFVGIPMTDMFKVVQYWCYEKSDDASSNTSTVYIGVKVHFIKQTMFKSQILSGTRDEVGVGAKKWCTYFNNSQDTLAGSSPSSGPYDEAVDTETRSHRSIRAVQEISTFEPATAEVTTTAMEKNSPSLWSQVTVPNIIILALCISILVLLRQHMILTSKFDEIVRALNTIEAKLDQNRR